MRHTDISVNTDIFCAYTTQYKGMLQNIFNCIFLLLLGSAYHWIDQSSYGKSNSFNKEIQVSQPSFPCSKLTVETPKREICSKLTIKAAERRDVVLVFYCWLCIDFIHCSGVSIIGFDQVNSGWLLANKYHLGQTRQKTLD